MGKPELHEKIVDWASTPVADLEAAKRALRQRLWTLDDLAARLRTTRGNALDAIDTLICQGINVQRFGDAWTIAKEPGPVEPGRLHKLTSDAQGRYRFGVISDTHLGSKYAREDVVDALYDWFAAEGIRTVYHCGNWIEGEARFNKYDLIDQAHGMQQQVDYMVERYPRRKGVETHYVAGDDHEGWYVQREGVDIGKILQMAAESKGRNDLKYLGYMEAFITLEHRKSGETSKLLTCHPGGGSAYATSYAIQKIAESWQPGEKPGVALFGHYHKLEYLITRGVHCIQAGSTKDSDTFARKRRLAYHIGGWIVELWQDPQGAISGCRPWLRQWFDRDYYNHQWNLAGPVRKTRAPHGRKRARKA